MKFKAVLILFVMTMVVTGFVSAQDAPAGKPVLSVEISRDQDTVLPDQKPVIDITIKNLGTGTLEFKYLSNEEILKNGLVALEVKAGANDVPVLKDVNITKPAEDAKFNTVSLMQNQEIVFKKVDLSKVYDFSNVVDHFTVKAIVNEKPTSLLNLRFVNVAVKVFSPKGEFVIELLPNVAENTCRNFVSLVKAGFYNKKQNAKDDKAHKVFRAINGQMISLGSPFGDGTGGPGYKIASETSAIQHEKGTVGMCRKGDDLNSAGSMFYITLTPQAALDGKYTVFGKIVSGIETIERLSAVRTTDRFSEKPFQPTEEIAGVINCKVIKRNEIKALETPVEKVEK